jgi:hypothetical protein
MHLSLARLGSILAIPLLATIARADVTQVVDVVGHVSLTDFNSNYASQSYKDWGNEPFVAVNPLNTSQIVVSGFGYSANGGGSSASLWYSSNGGASWATTFHLPAPATGILIPRDQTMAFDSSGILHLAVLGSSGTNNSLLNVYHGTTPNISTTNVTWTAGTVNQFAGAANNTDQPWLALSGNNLAVAYDNFGSGSDDDPEERVALSTNGGASFTLANDNNISSGGAINFAAATNPGNRIAMDSNGNIYAVFEDSNSISGTVPHVQYRLNYYNGTSWQLTNQDPAIPGGMLIDQGNSDQGNIAGESFGNVNNLRGGIDAIASDAAGQNVFIVYGKQDGTGTDRLYLATFHPSSQTITFDPNPISVASQRAALPSITVLANGTLELLYDTFSGGQFHIHLASSTDQQTFTDQDLRDFTAPSFASLGINGSDRELGDYQFIESIGNNFYGVFPAVGNVNSGGINTTSFMNPFFFSGSNVPEPAICGAFVWLIGRKLLGRRRGRRNHSKA